MPDSPAPNRSNDLSLEKELTRALGRPHRWKKHNEEWGTMFKYYNAFGPVSKTNPAQEPEPEPLGRTSRGENIYKWVCEECGDYTISDDPAFGECKGKEVDDDPFKGQNFAQILKQMQQQQATTQWPTQWTGGAPGQIMTWGSGSTLGQNLVGQTGTFLTTPYPSGTVAAQSTNWKQRLKKWMSHNPFVQKEKEQDE